MILYHRTLEGESILRKGFEDRGGTHLTTNWYEGVWLSDKPLDINESADGDDLLGVDIPEEVIADFEWVEEGKIYREWLIPAKIVNCYPVHRIVDSDD
jgi:hypothetical protein